MELIDRYLQAVNLALPRKQRNDVIKELSDEILSQVEEKETALGRPLTIAEQAALVKQFGHPMMLAARYRKQQYLISPAVFPIYWLVLRLVLVVVFFGMAVAAVALAATGQGLGTALWTLARYPIGAISAFAWVTLVFVVLEYFQAKLNFFDKWDARTLPKLSKTPPKTSMTESVAALIFGVIFGVWWLVGLKHQFLIFGPGVGAVHFGPVWQTVYPLFVVLVVADLIRHTIDVLRPGWQRGRTWFRMLFRVMNLVVLYFLINASDLLVAGDAAVDNLQPVIKGLNTGIHIGVIVAAIVTVAQTAVDVHSLWGHREENGHRAVVGL
jgi:hypothetical protein